MFHSIVEESIEGEGDYSGELLGVYFSGDLLLGLAFGTEHGIVLIEMLDSEVGFKERRDGRGSGEGSRMSWRERENVV